MVNDRHAESGSRVIDRLAHVLESGKRGVPNDADAPGGRGQLPEHLQPLGAGFGASAGHPGRVPSGTGQACGQTGGDRIVRDDEHNVHGGREALQREGPGVERSDDDVRFPGNDLGGEARQAFGVAVRETMLEDDVPSGDPSQLSQPLLDRIEVGLRNRAARRPQGGHPGDLPDWLRLYGERRCEKQNSQNGGEPCDRRCHNHPPNRQVTALPRAEQDRSVGIIMAHVTRLPNDGAQRPERATRDPVR